MTQIIITSVGPIGTLAGQRPSLPEAKCLRHRIERAAGEYLAYA